MPFDMDKLKADLILDTIFDTILKGALRDGKTTIQGLGQFYKHTRPPDRKAYNVIVTGRKIVSRGVIVRPARTYLAFMTCRSLLRSLRDENA